MPNSTLYRSRQARHRCGMCGRTVGQSGHRLCTRCRENKRLTLRAHTLAAWAAPGPNRLACCGQWWAVTAIPFTTPCCQTLYFALEGRP